jgi:Brp/Blh family beta-carotene 15,15'-monooxygenase
MNIYKYVIVLSFLSLWLNSYIPSNGLYLLGLFLILSFGVLHGANDIVIISKTFKKLKNKSLAFLIVFYLTFVLTFSLFFAFLPDFALLFFVILSAYHFGEQHWNEILLKNNKLLNSIFFLLYGSLIFALIFYFHQTEVEVIIDDIIGYSINLDFLQYLLFVLLTLIFSISVFYYRTVKAFRSQLAEQLLYLLVQTIIFRVSDLIWSFAIYFVLWHSLPSLNDQIKYIYGDINKKNVLLYLKKSSGYWLISIIGLGLFFWFFRDAKIFEALLFSFIAAITFPHVMVITKMFDKKSNN